MAELIVGIGRFNNLKKAELIVQATSRGIKLSGQEYVSDLVSIIERHDQAKKEATVPEEEKRLKLRISDMQVEHNKLVQRAHEAEASERNAKSALAESQLQVSRLIDILAKVTGSYSQFR